MSAKVIHEWTCDICGETVQQEQDRLGFDYSVIVYWQLPDGWSCINGLRMICKDHDIDVDGEPWRRRDVR